MHLELANPVEEQADVHTQNASALFQRASRTNDPREYQDLMKQANAEIRKAEKLLRGIKY